MIHTSHISGTGGGGPKTKGGTVLGAPPLGRSNRKIAIHPLSFGRNQSSSGGSVGRPSDRSGGWSEFADHRQSRLLLKRWHRDICRCAALPHTAWLADGAR
eukprot:7384112-Prymnesium_polylepis.1